MKLLISIFIILNFSVLSFKLSAQEGVIDSLKTALKKAGNDTTRCIILIELIESDNDDSSFPSYNDELFKLAEKGVASAKAGAVKKRFLKFQAVALNNYGYLAGRQGKIDKAIDYINKSLNIYEGIKDKTGVAYALSDLSFIYKDQGDIAKCLEYNHRTLKIFEEIQDKKGIANSLNNIGYIYKNQGDIPTALEYYHKGIRIYEDIRDKFGMATAINNIGLIYYYQGDHTKAIEYYNKSLKIRKEIQDKRGLAETLSNIGIVYKKQNNTSEALHYYQKSLTICEEIKYLSGKALALNNIGRIYEDRAESVEKTEYEKDSLLHLAFEFCSGSLKIREEIQDKRGVSESLCNMASIRLKQGIINGNAGQTGAYEYAIRSMQFAKELGYPERINLSAQVLKEIYKKQNKHKNALEMYELELQMRDSIYNEETKKASVKKQFQYQYEKKAAADSVKNAEEQKVKNAQLSVQQAQLKQERTQRFALYGGLILVIAFSGFVYNRFKITQKQKTIIERQKNEVDLAYGQLHEKNKEIMDSIIYARRIQRALITPEQYIHRQIKRLTKK